jgi:hypothetical protein
MSTQPNATAPAKKPPVIRVSPGQANFSDSWARIIPAWIMSGVINALIIGLFALTMFLGSSRAGGPAADVSTAQETQVEDAADKADLTNPDIGIDPTVPLNYDVDRIEDVSVPGPVNPDQAVGIPGAPPDAPMTNIPAPPGFGTQGLGKGIDSDKPGTAGIFGEKGGSGGIMMAGGFGGRSGSTREKLALQGGGNAASEAAVAEGLLWLARHQEPDGHWSLDRFNRNVNIKFPENGARVSDDGGKGQGSYHDDIAGTAFGVLPFLGAGETHKAPPPGTKKSVNYTKVVEAGLRYLISKQTREGQFPGTMYTHGLATIAMCEAYGLTSDPLLKGPAQKAIDFIVHAQNTTTGGWRYTPKSDGDTSVVGWQVMALKSGQMSGLSVPKSTLELSTKWLDSCMTSDKGGYGYTGPGETPTMTAVGLLCRMYLGWSPKNPGIQAGVNRLVPKNGDKYAPQVAGNNMYYSYYATQVMHHFGGERWESSWNPAMRDYLIKSQDKTSSPAHRGSWDPNADVHGKVGGRIMITSLSMLTLEVYYRHLPLYRREAGVMKDVAQ